MNNEMHAQTSLGPSSPRIVPRSQHSISRADISPNALKVLYRLKEAGYQSFLVGGAVRDLLLGGKPKDFDVATNAHPQEVRSLFRNCRLIGRRFHLAHVRFGYEIVEVATFRAAHTTMDEDNAIDEAGHRVLDARGRILRDNLYGTIEEDIWRRDFTANALYYNIEDFSVWDYCGGFEDCQAGVLRLIGDPATRYREDPVRMLRAMRFAAKLNFRLHEDTATPIRELAWMLDGVPPARLFDEVNKLFLAGSALRAFELLEEYELVEHLLPPLAAALASSQDALRRSIVEHGLRGTDERVATDKSVTPTFLFFVLLWPAILDVYASRPVPAGTEAQELQAACDIVVSRQQSRVAIPRRFTLPMREIAGLQARLARRDGRRALRVLDHPRFRAAYDFLLLRAAAGEVEQALADWWTTIQTVTAEERVALVEQTVRDAPDAQQPPRRRRRRRRRPPAL
ncbi:MAG TPA: polynucleotide adenylyltransferase PcnB [Steroidobacteraceae bacterium]|nr:polynucleotide adenylyltransferase PcnB [Steroidobacteraceae bacterium]